MSDTAAELLALVERNVEDCSERDVMYDKLEEFYFLEGERDDDDAEEEVEKVRLPHGTNTVDLVQDLLSGAGLQITVPAAGETAQKKKQADAAEDFLRTAIHESERARHVKVLGRAAWLAAMRGCLCGRVVAKDDWLEKVEDDEGLSSYQVRNRLPLQLQMRDPRYVYPKFGTDGLAFIAERWTRTVQDIRNSYGDDILPGRPLTEEIDWTEYWDTKQYCYWAGEEPVGRGGVGAGPWPHGYGGNPYAWAFARQTAKAEPDKRIRPLLKGIQPVIRWLDLLDSMTMTFIARYNGDALNVYSDSMAAENSDRFVDVSSGAVNYLLEGERIEWLRAGRQPLELGMLRNEFQAMLERGTFPGTLYGQDPGRVMAGYAINMLNQSGQTRMLPILACIEEFFSSLLENVLMVAENHVAPLVGGSIEFFVYEDAEDDEGERRRVAGERKFEPEKLEGRYIVEVQLGEILPADEQANIVLATRARTADSSGRPLLSHESTMEKFKLTDSPQEERQRIDREMAWNDPVVMALRQKVYAAQAVMELRDELAELDVSDEEIEELIAKAQQTTLPEPELPQTAMVNQPPGGPVGAPPMAPPGVMPPEMQGGGPQGPMQIPEQLRGIPPELLRTYLQQLQQLPQMQMPGGAPGMGY